VVHCRFVANRISALAILMLLGGCCLSTIDGASNGGETSGPNTNRETTSGTTSGEPTGTTGGGTSGGATSSSGSGSTTGGYAEVDGGCADTFCAPGYLCDPADGICRCGGQDCEGECGGGTCLALCPSDAGGGPFAILGGASAIWLPTATVGSPYMYQLGASCGSPTSLAWGGIFPLDLGLSLSSHGLISGVPQKATSNGPFELEITVGNGQGGAGVQNYLLEIVGPDGGT
jgi:hypothetical protein